MNVQNILTVYNHKRKSAGGYKRFYADDLEQPDKTKIIA